jgi:hypothetical protein
MFDFILKPLGFIMEVINFVICLIDYLKKVFVWTGKTLRVCIMIIFTLPFCFCFYIFHAIWLFLQFVILDVLLTVILLPSQIVGKALGYPLSYKYDAKRKKTLRDNTSLMTLYNNFAPKLMKTCYSFDSIGPFPQWDLKIPKF